MICVLENYCYHTMQSCSSWGKIITMSKGRKTGGRVLGATNILKKEIRVVLNNFVFSELENMESLVANLEPHERVEILLKMLPFVLPKVRNIAHDCKETFMH